MDAREIRDTIMTLGNQAQHIINVRNQIEANSQRLQELQEGYDTLLRKVVADFPEFVTGFTLEETVAIGADGKAHVVPVT